MINILLVMWAVVGSGLLIAWLCSGNYFSITNTWKRQLFLLLCGPVGWIGFTWNTIIIFLSITKISQGFTRFFIN